MAKRSRRPVRPATPATSAAPLASTPSTSTSPGSTESRPPATTPSSTRAARRPRTRRVRQQSPLERYRTWIIAGAATIGVLIIGYVFFSSGVQAAYSCGSLLTPGPVESVTPRPSLLVTPTAAPSATPADTAVPSAAVSPIGTDGAQASPATSASPATPASPATSAGPATSASPAPSSPEASAAPSAAPSPSASASPSPEPEPTARLGFTTTILGQTHVTSPSINYAYCPPTSGNHYNIAGRGPLAANVYPANDERTPGGWVHNLEHGWVVALYRCPGGVLGQGECITQDEFTQMQQWFNQVQGTPECPKQVLVARFDSMSTKFALLAWGRAYLVDNFSLDTANTFAQQWVDHEAVPERGTC